MSVRLFLLGMVAFLAACSSEWHLTNPNSDYGRFNSAVEAAGCEFDFENPPDTDFSNHYDMNPGLEKSRELDISFAKGLTRNLLDEGLYVRMKKADGSEIIRSRVGACGGES